MSLITEIKGNLVYPELTICEELDMLLLEIKKTRLMNNTDLGRRTRAVTQVRTRPMRATLIDEEREIWMLEYNFKAFPSKEEKRHWGYIIYDQPHKDITQVFCDCRDFFYRLYAPFVRKKLATYKIPGNYFKQQQKEFRPGERPMGPHNKQWTITRNPSGRLFACKHLYAALKGYVED